MFKKKKKKHAKMKRVKSIRRSIEDLQPTSRHNSVSFFDEEGKENLKEKTPHKEGKHKMPNMPNMHVLE